MNGRAFKYAGVILPAGALAACGGGDFRSGTSGSTGGGSGGTLITSLGSGTGSSFQAGVLQLSSTALSAGGSTSVTATLQNSDGTASMGPGQSATFYVSDLNGNVPAAGSKIGIAQGGSASASVLNTTVPNMPCSSSPPGPAGNRGYAVSITTSATDTAGQSFVITATSPGGLVSFSQAVQIN